jgi:cytochrome c5
MAAPHHEQHSEEASSFIKTPQQLITVVVLAFVVPIALIAMLATLVLSKSKYDADHPDMTDEAIARRIKPVGDVILAGTPEAAAVAAQAAADASQAPAATKTAAVLDGKGVYDKVCVACHAAGIAGAPKTGDKAAWAPRIKQGMDALHTSALKGKGAMPPKGGAAQLSDDEIKAAVDYLVGLAK